MPKTAATNNADGGNLQVRLVGTATYQGARVALVEQGPSGKQCLLKAGDDFEGYRVEEVKTNLIRFRYGKSVHSLTKQGIRSSGVTSTKTFEPISPKVKVLKAGQSKIRVVNPYTSTSKTKTTARFISPMIGEVKSGFGYRKHPMGGANHHHDGVDIAAPRGTRVKAAASGVVTESSYDSFKGNNIVVKHADGYKTCYFHLSKRVVSKNAKVSRGQTIGYEGSTGHSTGAHLHFEILKNGNAINPALYISSLKN